MNTRKTPAWALGEIALRVNNLDAMQKFYEVALACYDERV
jgi:hypothetical protein